MTPAKQPYSTTTLNRRFAALSLILGILSLASAGSTTVLQPGHLRGLADCVHGADEKGNCNQSSNAGANQYGSGHADCVHGADEKGNCIASSNAGANQHGSGRRLDINEDGASPEAVQGANR